jgi:hypothetical protein
MALDDDLRSIRSQISDARGRQARAQVQADNARTKVAEGKATLQKDFGVVTNEEAKAKLVELEAALEAEVASVKHSLAEAS